MNVSISRIHIWLCNRDPWTHWLKMINMSCVKRYIKICAGKESTTSNIYSQTTTQFICGEDILYLSKFIIYKLLWLLSWITWNHIITAKKDWLGHCIPQTNLSACLLFESTADAFTKVGKVTKLESRNKSILYLFKKTILIRILLKSISVCSKDLLWWRGDRDYCKLTYTTEHVEICFVSKRKKK